MNRVLDPRLRRARTGVALVFMTNGILLGNLAPRLPEIRDGLELSYGGLGLAMAMWPIGSLGLGLLAGAMIRRFRSSRVAVVSMIGSALAMVAAGFTSSALVFGAALFVVGVTDAWVDVAQNSHGLRVQRLYKRSINNAFHAMWSLGAVVGGLMGGAAAGLGVPVHWHFVAMAALAIAINLGAYPLLLTGPEPRDLIDHASDEATVPHTTKLRRVPRRLWFVLLALSLIGIAGGWAEDAASTWSASYLRDELSATATIAALGFVSLQGFQFIGRMTGDRLIDRFGQRNVARVGGGLVAVGMGLSLLVPSVWGTIAGFGAAGLGIATLIPGVFHAADELPGLKQGTGLTVVSWLLRVAFLASPPLVGAIADATSLRVGLAIVPALGVLVVLLAGVMESRRDRYSEPHPTPL